jgi:hypothetical protein
VTPVFPAPATIAVNCWLWETFREPVDGVTEIATGTKVTLADAVPLGLVAVTVTLCMLAMAVGAV